MARKIAVIDSETDPFKRDRVPKPFVWGFYDGSIYKEFEQVEDLIIYCYDKRLIVYAHNGGKFDYHFMLNFIEPFTDIMIINGRISSFKIGECEFRDSYNILPTALSAYQKTQIDYAIFEPKERTKKKNKKLISDYLKDDCFDLYNYVSSFIEKFGMNLTVAGTAMKQWQRISGIKAPRDLGGVNYEKFKSFYYGGRCESFTYGIIKGDFEMIDINSAYPYAMLSNHPISIDHMPLSYAEWEALPSDLVKGPTFIMLEGISKGALPFRGKDNSLYFPNDNIKRTYRVTGWELLAAIETGALFNWEYIEGFIFNETINFSDYVLHYYEERKEAKRVKDILGDIFSKLMMNSLYGKFGSNPEEYKSYQTAPHDVIDNNGCAGEWSYAGDFGNNALLRKELDEEGKRFYNLPTAASITGFVRAYLWRALCQCDGLLYCDTDSIAAKKINLKPGHFGKELGQWDWDGEFKSGAFAGRKLYAMEYKKPITNKEGKKITHKIASKGVRLNAKEIYKVAGGNKVIYMPEAPTFSIHKEPRFTPRTINISKKSLQ